MIAGFLAPWIIQIGIVLLHLILPARHVDGYVIDPETNKPFRYRLNGLLVLIASVGLWYLAGYLDLVPYDFLYTHRWSGFVGAIALGLTFTFALVLPAKSTGASFLADLYLGRIENPQFLNGRIDAKMILYLLGAVLLELNILSFCAHHLQTYPEAPNPGVFLSAGLLTYFLLDYLTFERVHLWTYDFFAERVGFKLGWGCICFYPYFYGIGLWNTVDLPDPGRPTWWFILSAVIFFTGWGLSRGANLQKFTFKTEPNKVYLGFIEPKTLTDGSRTLLVSGFWGLSRHINYLGEILMATGITLALGYPAVLAAWLYPLYYVALLFPRQWDDDRRCSEKYGALWDEYEAAVPYRIIPWIY